MDVGYFIIDKNGNIVGKEDTTKFDNANWYQRLFARISNKYRKSLTMLVPIEINLKTNEHNQWIEQGILFSRRIEVDLVDRNGCKNSISSNDIINNDFVNKMLNESKDKRWTIKLKQ